MKSNKLLVLAMLRNQLKDLEAEGLKDTNVYKYCLLMIEQIEEEK